MTTPDAARQKAAAVTEEQAYISLVIPAYNEEKRLRESLRQVHEYFQKQGYRYETIVVDDGSSDATVEIVQKHFPWVRLLTHSPNRGKGYTVRQGMLAATGRYRFYYDADASTPIYELDKVWAYFEAGADIVIGSRSLPESDVQIRQGPIRQNMGRTFNKFAKLILRERFIDTQCGFKGFTEKSAGIVFPRQRVERFSFDAELLHIARKHKLLIAEVPVIWCNDPDSRVKIVSDSLRMLRDLLMIRLRDLAGAYK